MSSPMTAKSPLLASLLSAFVPGLGQLYNGRVASGLVYFVLAGLSWLLTLVMIGVFLIPVVTIASIVSAYRGAKQVNAEFRGQVNPTRVVEG